MEGVGSIDKLYLMFGHPRSRTVSVWVVAGLIIVPLLVSDALAAPVQSSGSVQQAAIFESLAYAPGQSAADRQALQQLERKLHQAIRENPSYCASPGAKYVVVCNQRKDYIVTRNYLPLLGIRFQRTEKTSVLHGAQVSLSRANSLAAYKEALENEKTILENWQQQGEKVRGLQRAKLSSQNLHLQLARYYQLAIVAALLGDNRYLNTAFDLPGDGDSQQPVAKFDSIDDAVSYVSGEITVDPVYVYPPRPASSVEITPFGRQFQDKLRAKMAEVLADTPFGNYTLSGQYAEDNDSLLVTLQLYSDNFLLQERLQFHLAKTAVDQNQVEPVAPKFDQEFAGKQQPATDFRSEITTQLGSEDLLFRQGDTVKLYVRLTKPGYFYIVGHIARKQSQYSYLLDIVEGNGDDKFVMYVPPDKANQLIELGEFTVDAPFGVEYLQLMAATENPVHQLPPYHWDKKREYYVIEGSNGNALEGLNKVRGLKKKRHKIHYHESQLVYTTAPK